MSRGRLVTIEGIDGVGKTTHAALVADYLKECGYTVQVYREPGGTELGERLRAVIKDGAPVSPLAELLLFAASRAELVYERLRPALAEGSFIVLDRFTDSTFSYQGALKQIPEDILDAICNAASGGLVPDLTFWLDLDPVEALSRRYPLAEALADGQVAQALDAIERRDTGYFTRVRSRYQALQASEPRRILRIEAGGTVEQTAAAIRQHLELRLKEWKNG